MLLPGAWLLQASSSPLHSTRNKVTPAVWQRVPYRLPSGFINDPLFEFTATVAQVSWIVVTNYTIDVPSQWPGGIADAS